MMIGKEELKMIKYEVFLYDIWKDEDGHYVYDTFALGK